MGFSMNLGRVSCGWTWGRDDQRREGEELCVLLGDLLEEEKLIVFKLILGGCKRISNCFLFIYFKI